MKKIFVLFLIMGLLSGCGKDIGYVDSGLSPYVDDFFAEAAAHGINLSRRNLVVEFVDLQGQKAGSCKKSYQRYIDGKEEYKTVSVDISFWDKANEPVREFVIFHELGHCLLNRGHSSGANTVSITIPQEGGGTETGQIYSNYMVSSIGSYIDESLYYFIKPYYLEVLFYGSSDLLDDYLMVEAISSKAQLNQEFIHHEHEDDEYGCEFSLDNETEN